VIWLINSAITKANSIPGVKFNTITPLVTTKLSWKKALGWPVAWGSSYLVWEQWPEIFTPSISWGITPNNKIWWSSIVINISWVFGSDVWEEIANMILKKLQRTSYA
jgi:hypothetical protein